MKPLFFVYLTVRIQAEFYMKKLIIKNGVFSVMFLLRHFSFWKDN